MIINELILENFHGFEKREITFSEQFTVLIGDNGTGKTAILDGLAIALGSFLSGLNGVQSRHIRRDEVHRKTFIQGGLADIQLQFPVKITCKGTIGDQKLEWSRSLRGKQGSTTSKEAKAIMEYASELQGNVSAGRPVILPLVSYYGTGRLWVQRSERNEYKIRNDRLGGYSFCLDPASSEKHFTRWMEKMTYIELQRKQAPEVLDAVRKAVSVCMKTWRTIEFDVDSEELRAVKEDGTILPFRLLSDGVRNMIGMIADIAHRMAQLNPALEASVVKETPGVVLIDELDLHLHPKWQRSIVNDLKRTFPKIQFIVTSHSPFIIQSLDEGELRRLQEIDDDEEVMSDEFVNRSIEDISEIAMGIEGVQRSEKLNEMYRAAKEYYALLQQAKNTSSEELEELKQKLDDIESLYSSDVAYYAFLEMERKAADLGRNNG
ncbi:AAA family ATPase [Paenibacillus sp. P96]|uniref:AAA family ATPase n=1 Tax=Paenibacillus zeirhizosphaerae TaxID=2987519 RepID=A0ABT9FNA6_9BACL|nr:AAA family ATPase [Paenibacillus sp. P96]MDP4096228.1 AAA family ATPase [Paenibacillus sp. P96]